MIVLFPHLCFFLQHCAKKIRVPPISEMNSYLSLVKRSDKKVDLSSSSKSISLLPKWPSYLNAVASDGRKSLLEFSIDESNYKYLDFISCKARKLTVVDWLLKQNFVPKRNVFMELAAFGKPDFLKTHEKDLKEGTFVSIDDLLNHAIMADNLQVIFHWFSEHRPVSFLHLVKFLRVALTYKSKKCCDHLTFLITDMLKEGIHKTDMENAIWSSLAYYGDISLIGRLEDALKTTTCNNLAEDGDPLTEDARDCMMGSAQNVKRVLEGKKLSPSLTGLVLSRIVHVQEEEQVSRVFENYARNLIESCEKDTLYSLLTTSIMSSRRDPDITARMVKFASKLGLKFPQNGVLNLTTLTVQSWIAIRDNPELYSYDKVIMNNSVISYFDCEFLRAENRNLLESMIIHLTSVDDSRDWRTELFLFLGTTVTQWGYKNGLIDNFSNPKDAAFRSATYGNIISLTLALMQLEKEERPLEIKNFLDKYVHVETVPFLNWWFDEEDEGKKKKLLTEEFSPWFYDTSIIHNNRNS